MSSYPTAKGLSQLDFGGVLRDVHEIKAEALRVIDLDTLVGSFFTRADITYDVDGNATGGSFYYDKTYHVEDITVLGDSGGSLNNEYFLVNTPGDISKFYVWYNVNGAGVDPAIPGREGIQVPLSTGDTANIVALATRLATSLNANFSADFTTQNIENIVRITSKILGQVTIDISNTTFTSEVITLGVTELVKTITLDPIDGFKYVYNEFTKTIELFQIDTSSGGGGGSLPAWDQVLAEYPDTITEVYTYFKDAALVLTITVEYTSQSKKYITSVTKVTP